ncbi:MAG: RteC domain-containing protein [Flavobacteriaceae bacterium]|nr:RteC domain-containing protein [Flavobacteriaceae bacterium]
MDWILPKETFENELLDMERSFLDPMALCHEGLNYCGNLLETYRSQVARSGFPDETAEIQFFKTDKPLVHGNYLHYALRLQLALDIPLMDLEQDRQHIKSLIEHAHKFLSRHHPMALYLLTGATHNDARYFLRKNRGGEGTARFHLQHFDPAFCTSHDGLVAHIRAQKSFQQHLLDLLGISPKMGGGHPVLQWTGSKTDLMELILALAEKRTINNGQATFKELVTQFQQIFGVDFGDPYHLAMRLRNRSHPTKFIDGLSRALLGRIDDLEG